MSRGLFIAFEGIDGAGKSTQARRVAAAHGALFTVEPGGTDLGAELRLHLLDAESRLSAATEALLMLADRAHHVATVIEPALAAGRPVVSDRFSASTIAYQGFGRGADLAQLAAATSLAIGACRPDLTILVDVPVDVARARCAGTDRFEREGAEFFERVRRGFRDLSENDLGEWAVVDGSRSIEEVNRAVDDALAAVGWTA